MMICDQQMRQMECKDIRTGSLTERADALMFVDRPSLLLGVLYTRKGVYVGDTDTLAPSANGAYE